MRPSPPSCERFRFALSLAFDGELSELEQAALDDHLRSCADCRAAARAGDALTSALRGAPLEPVELRLALPQARRRVRPILVAAAVAVVGVAVGLGSLAGSLTGATTPRLSRAALAESARPLIQQQVIALDLAAPRHRRPGGRVIAE